ncbi:MAG: hypothetical protein ACYC7D_00235 [Nitrososphaerales archaeon]
MSKRYLSLLMGLISISLALGWGKFIGRVVYLPEFDYLDVLLGIVVGVYLMWIWITGAK